MPRAQPKALTCRLPLALASAVLRYRVAAVAGHAAFKLGAAALWMVESAPLRYGGEEVGARLGLASA